MRWFYYGTAVVVTVFSVLLWSFVLREAGAGRVSVVAERTAVDSSAVLPVVPKLHVASVAEILEQDRNEGRAVCADGAYARPILNGQAVTILVDGQPIACQ